MDSASSSDLGLGVLLFWRNSRLGDSQPTRLKHEIRISTNGILKLRFKYLPAFSNSPKNLEMCRLSFTGWFDTVFLYEIYPVPVLPKDNSI